MSQISEVVTTGGSRYLNESGYKELKKKVIEIVDAEQENCE